MRPTKILQHRRKPISIKAGMKSFAQDWLEIKEANLIQLFSSLKKAYILWKKLWRMKARLNSSLNEMREIELVSKLYKITMIIIQNCETNINVSN